MHPTASINCSHRIYNLFKVMEFFYVEEIFRRIYCVVNFSSFYNVVLSVSPLCSYLLDIITICNGSLTKMWYIFGGFVIIKITEVFGRINVFSNYSKKPNESTCNHYSRT